MFDCWSFVSACSAAGFQRPLLTFLAMFTTQYDSEIALEN